MSDSKDQISEKTRKRMRKRINHDLEQQEKALEHNSPSLRLLRSHILTEYYLDKIIVALLPRGDKVGDFSYSKKLIIVEAFDIMPQNLVDSLKSLNSIRNNLSHKLNYEITQEDINKVGHPLGKKYRELKNEHVGNESELTKEVLDQMFGSLSYVVYRVEEGDASLGEEIDAME